MIEKETMKQIYENWCSGKELTTKELKNYGLSSNDLTNLVADGMLERVSRGYYSPSSVELLISCGKKYESCFSKQELALKYFQRAQELDPKNLRVNYHLFSCALMLGQYEEAFEYFKSMYEQSRSYNKREQKVFLYLFNIILELPEEYRKIAQNMTLPEMLVQASDRRYKMADIANKIRKDIFNGDLESAAGWSLYECDKQIQELQLRKLLLRALSEQKKKRPSVTKLKPNRKELSSAQEKNKNFTLKPFLSSKIEKLQAEGGVILLGRMDAEELKETQQAINQVPGVTSLKIGYTPNEQLVLKKHECGEYKNLASSGIQAYNERNYSQCIDIYEKLLSYVKEPKIFVLQILGLSYMQRSNGFIKNDIKKAIEYLTIAHTMNLNPEGMPIDSRYDFLELIERLKSSEEEKEIKPKVKMSESEFENDLKKDYGIRHFEEISELIFEMRMDVDLVCKQYGLTSEETQLMKLVYAKDCYAKTNFSIGDRFVKMVSKEKERTKRVNKLITEIGKNKNLYQYRAQESSVEKSIEKVKK